MQIKLIVLGMLVIFMQACSSPKSILLQDKAKNNYIYEQYLVGVDDVIQVNVWRNPELSVTVPVRPDGKISVPLLGDVEAGGKSPEDIATYISEKLVTFIRDPQVTVIIAQLRSHEYISRVRITGAVNVQRSLAYRQGMTVLDVVLESGGPSLFAKADSSKLYRKQGDGKMRNYDIYLDAILSDGELETNYQLMPGDVISVPERTF
ncbi:MAG: polysaccharide biosynthesis/export family protein [Pseudomonadales bacterium]|nr:polysaccharide biosynthesis/export family protein [Pseudomonadales bacterium]